MSFVSSLFGGGKKEADPALSAPPPPSTSTEPNPSETAADKAKRLGRLALIATTSRGVLDSPSTARQLLSAF